MQHGKPHELYIWMN